MQLEILHKNGIKNGIRWHKKKKLIDNIWKCHYWTNPSGGELRKRRSFQTPLTFATVGWRRNVEACIPSSILVQLSLYSDFPFRTIDLPRLWAKLTPTRSNPMSPHFWTSFFSYTSHVFRRHDRSVQTKFLGHRQTLRSCFFFLLDQSRIGTWSGSSWVGLWSWIEFPHVLEWNSSWVSLRNNIRNNEL